MDSEKHHHIQELIKNGRSANDEGPFYHHTFWESYKGSIKGKLGGTVIGAIGGAIVGGAIFAAASVAGLTAITVGLGPMAVIGGLSAAGMLYANHEFSEVGRITGAVASAQKDAERRMQEFEQSRFDELKNDINEIKSSIGVKNTEKKTLANSASQAVAINAAAVDEKLDSYRTTHHDPSIPKPKNNGYVFWKVALVGLAVGSGVGLLLEAVGSTSAIASALGSGLGALIEGPKAAAITGGIIGASFGINRDFFRKIFDKTDLAFKGMFNFIEPTVQPQIETPTLNASKDRPQVSTLVYPESTIEYPASDTFHRDQLAARANQALASLDHTTVSRH